MNKYIYIYIYLDEFLLKKREKKSGIKFRKNAGFIDFFMLRTYAMGCSLIDVSKKKKGEKEREDNSLSSLFDPMVEKEGNGDV